jgi:DNA-binding SARP family transcriptional activator/streptogramin lyase
VVVTRLVVVTTTAGRDGHVLHELPARSHVRGARAPRAPREAEALDRRFRGVCLLLSGNAMEFRVLGPLEVLDERGPRALRGSKQRTLLAYLLLHANVVVSSDQLIDVLWGEDPPPTATHTLHVYVSDLRKLLRDSGNVELVTEGHGYALRVPNDAIDLTRFSRRAEEGRRALVDADLPRASEELRAAGAMWRGAPLSDLPYGGSLAHEIARLDELRLSAIEDRVEADLALGRHADLVGELTALTAANPLRERLRAQQVLAMYRSGRQAEALQSLGAFRQHLGTDLGIDPGPALQQLEVQILQHDPELNWHEVPPPPVTVKSVTETRPAKSGRQPIVVGTVIAGLLAVVLLAIALARSDSAQTRPSVIAPNGVGRIDPATAELLASISTAGAAPGPMAWADGSLWVANTYSGTVARIDPASDEVVQSVPTDGTPTDLAAGEGAVWVLNGLEGEVAAIDPRTNLVIASISVPEGSGGIAVGAGFVWVASTIDTAVKQINPATETIVHSIQLGPRGSGRPKAIAVGDGNVWVGDELAPGMWEIQVSTGAVVETPGLRAAPSSILVADDGAVWFTGYDEDVVSVMDPSSLQVTTYPEVGRGPTDLAAGAGAIWVVESLDGTVAGIDPSTGAVVARERVGGNPQGVAVGGGSVWVSRPA